MKDNNTVENHFLYKKTIIRREDNVDYLIRYSLKLPKCLPFQIKLHKILVSDDYCLHDHPWSFMSLILKGGYWEYLKKVDYDASYNNILSLEPNKTYNFEDVFKTYITKTWYGPFSVLYRKPNSVHRLELPKGKTCTTLVITFKKVGSWGFYTKKGFIDHKDYNINMCE